MRKRTCLLVINIIAIGVIWSQERPKNYFSINIGLTNPMGKFASSGSVNATALLTSFINTQSESSGSSLLLPPVLDLSYSSEGAWYYTELGVDASALQNSVGQLISDGVGILLPAASSALALPEGTQGILNGLKFSPSLKNTNWQIFSFLLGPSLAHKSGKFTFDFSVKGGILSVTSPKVTSGLDYSIPVFIGNVNGTLLQFDQASISKNIFAYQIGYGIKYSILENISVRLFMNYTSSFNTDFNVEVNPSLPSLSQIEGFINGNNGQDGGLNITLPVTQKTTITMPVANLNFGVGVCYDLPDFIKKKKAEAEPDVELEKQK
jgi:opacity protein-like surface antigen